LVANRFWQEYLLDNASNTITTLCAVVSESSFKVSLSLTIFFSGTILLIFNPPIISGGTARMTNRGASNNSLIRHGQNQASVEITLFNGGENCYKPEVKNVACHSKGN
jgi:hypothetical protein